MLIQEEITNHAEYLYFGELTAIYWNALQFPKLSTMSCHKRMQACMHTEKEFIKLP